MPTKKPGRPLISKDGDRQLRRQVSLSNAHLDKARALGNGNVSAGIRLALDEIYVRPGHH